MEHQHSAQPHHSHAVPLPLLVGVLLALLVLTVVTVGIAQVDLGAFNFPVAMLVATIKATLVALLFMHLLWDKRFNLLLLTGSIVLLGLFLAMTLLDSAQYQKQIEWNQVELPSKAATATNH